MNTMLLPLLHSSKLPISALVTISRAATLTCTRSTVTSTTGCGSRVRSPPGCHSRPSTWHGPATHRALLQRVDLLGRRQVTLQRCRGSDVRGHEHERQVHALLTGRDLQQSMAVPRLEPEGVDAAAAAAYYLEAAIVHSSCKCSHRRASRLLKCWSRLLECWWLLRISRCAALCGRWTRTNGVLNRHAYKGLLDQETKTEDLTSLYKTAIGWHFALHHLHVAR